MIKKIDVFARGVKVGTLVLTKENKVAFQYDEKRIENGFSISPFKLPLSREIFYSSSQYFRGLFGVFADSLPDSYGELLLERFLKNKNIDINKINCLDRLAYVGSSGMGLLEYVPDLSNKEEINEFDFDSIQKECSALLAAKRVNNIEKLFYLGGSSGGARPKSLINFETEDYIVKFSSRLDPKNIAQLEYDYMNLAKKCGINIPDIKLINSKSNKKYYLIKRFDRNGKNKIHMISVAALLEVDFRAPSLDYNELIKLTRILTNKEEDILEMYRRMVFNCLMDNQDDHAKNFAFLYDETSKEYRLSPAYDLTPGKTYFGEHTTSVNGKGKEITEEDMLEVAKKNLIKNSVAKEIINNIKSITSKYFKKEIL